ncbi:MAG: NAD(P)/FAD-dependent oxidoreductase [Rubinisphaera brasiliensis]|uniref:NAD(P)/FAD-dependent oxidoreductase n=1 Tax=Rubinisphaera brasiliensis TaxID=119 RepID=UPI00391BCD7A
MKLRLTNLMLPVLENEHSLPEMISQRLGVTPEDLLDWRILRKSLDARNRYDLQFVYTLQVHLPDDLSTRSRFDSLPGVSRFSPADFEDPTPGAQSSAHRPVVVGSGPAGLLAGYYLAKKGYQPLVLERGKAVKERVPAIRTFDRGGEFDRENNYLFGEGGAGCFSDGKLTCRLSGPDVDWVLEAFVVCGGKSSIVYEQRPHLGSNKLPMICRNFRRKIEEYGGEYRFDCCVEKLDVRDGKVRGLHTSSGYIETEHVILGIGHSARDTYEMLHDIGVPIQQKPFQLGLRIEQPQDQVNNHKYGQPEYEQILGAADYSMVAKGNRDLYTFCMCAGGFVIPSVSEPEMFCSNGMSRSRHDTAFANSGLMVTLNPEEFGSRHPLAGVELQRKFERVAYKIGRNDYLSPIQWASDFVKQKCSQDPQIPSSYERGVVAADLSKVLPEPVLKALLAGLPLLDKRWKGDFLKNATLVGPEMRGSAPVRIERDRDNRQTPGFDGLYPVGEGAGYAGGIVTAAVDGLRSARHLVANFAPVSAQ